MEMENKGKLNFYSVFSQSCGNNRGSSSVYINYNQKVYSIRLPNVDCLKYPIGSKIGLIYNDKFDYFYIPDGLEKDISRLIFIGVVIIILLIKWKGINIRRWLNSARKGF